MSPPIKATENSGTSVSPAEIENQQPSTYTSVLQREDLLKKRQLVLRSIGFLFSFVSFVVMASNNHGYTTDGLLDYSNQFRSFEAYRYLLAVAIISTAYTKFQVLRQIVEFSTRKYLLSQRGMDFLDFFGDQIIAYLLMSAASTAVPTTHEWKQAGVLKNVFTDSATVSISMAFAAFVAVALSAMISGFKLSTQTYI